MLQEITMHVHGHTTVWASPIGARRARTTKRWYQQLRDRWAAHHAVLREAHLAARCARWDATREAVTPGRADAAPEMAAARHALSVATVIDGLGESGVGKDSIQKLTECCMREQSSGAHADRLRN